MEKNIYVRVFKIISIILILIAVVCIALVWMQDSNQMKTDQALQNKILNPYFVTAYIALATCLILALIFPIINIISEPKNGLRVLIGIAALVIISVIAYSLSTNELNALQLMEYKISEVGSRQIGAALIGTYVIAGASVLAILYAELSNLFKQ